MFTRNRRPPRLHSRLAPYAGTVLIFLLWWIAALSVGREILLPSPIRVAHTLVSLVMSPGFFSTVFASFARWLSGFLIALGAAILSGTLCSRREWATGMLRPLVVVVRSVPVIAVILLALIWLPVNRVPIFISLLITFPLLHQGVLDGLRSIDSHLVDMGRLFHVPIPRRIRHIHIPGSLPVVLSALTGAVGMSWKAVIAAEVLSQPVFGIGSDLHLAKLYLETAEVIAWTIVAILLAAIGDSFIWAVDGRMNAWRSTGRLDSSRTDVGDGSAGAAAARPLPLAGSNLAIASDPGTTGVRLESVSFSFHTTRIFEDLTLEIPPGTVTAVLGRSGSGKTTLLRLIAGDLRPDTGHVILAPQEDAGVPPVGFIFQEPRLLPWRSVLANVELVLPARKPRTFREGRRKDLISFLHALRLPQVEAYPSTLSGGMRHRVNLARGFLSGAPVICMDEPFANQDIATRRDLVALTRTLESHLGRSVILVTHDPDDAFTLADRIIVLADRHPTTVIAHHVLTACTEEELKRIRLAVDTALNSD
jgi:ABC-type nitrate/sulfonate/bicarbonate transport system ATPase subunit/ABC-type nitrate/sulfonate/bicarbonate transport system permease component